MVQSLNPGIKNTNKQLFGDLGEKFEFDQSMSRFYSTPNTKIENDLKKRTLQYSTKEQCNLTKYLL